MHSKFLKACALGAVGAAGWMLAMSSCVATDSQEERGARKAGSYEDPLSEITQEMLSPLRTPAQFNNVTGVLTVTVAPGELAMISLGPVGSGANPVLVNGVQPIDATAITGGPATSSSVISALVLEGGSGSAGTTEVILDYTNGIFAPGLSSGGSVTVDLAGTESTILGIKGQSGADHIVFGALGINVSNPLNTSGRPDVVWGSTAASGKGGAGTFIVSMGDGNDYFSAGGDPTGTPSPILGGVFDNSAPASLTVAPNFPAKGIMLFGGAGDDTFDESGAPTPYETILGGGDPGDTVDYSSRNAGVNVALGVLGIASSGLSGHCSGAGSSGSCPTDEHDDISSDIAIVNGGSGNDYFTAFSGVVATAPSDAGSGDANADSDAKADSADAKADSADAKADSADAKADAVSDAKTDSADAKADSADSAADAGPAPPGPGPAFNGNDGNDTFTPYGGTYVMNGGNGNDTFLMGGDSSVHGPGAIVGGSGVDTIDFSARAGSVHVTLDGTLVAPYTGTLSGTYSNSTAVEGMIAGQDVENIKGGAGNDVLAGNALNNVINGGLGSDDISGHGGFDTVDYSDRSGAVWVAIDGVAHSGASSHVTRVYGTAPNNYTDGSCTLNTGTGLNNTGSDENDTIALDIQNVTGGSGNDCLFGQPAGSSCANGVCQNSLVGGTGSDMLFGFDDDDSLDGTDSASANYLDCGGGSGDMGRNPGTGGYRTLSCEL